ncbi:sensor histidine kinase [Hamadaea tsunoensis]|uniref:sensor histidine kinase n=1 Tax=Hamadaea tsunoensis TaxID=53368 RepID=UPI0004096CF1|nr:histidine kinase [Hamadaea tsunoensis]
MSSVARFLAAFPAAVWGPDPGARKPVKPRPPLVVAALILLFIGFAAVTGQYLMDSRGMNAGSAWLLSLFTIGPITLAWRSPLWAWRWTFVGLFAGTVYVRAAEAWQWSPSQILVILVVLFMVALREPGPVIVWAGVLTAGASSFYTVNGGAVIVLVAALMVLGEQIQRRRRAQSDLAASQERGEQAEADRALLEERARIARELHDVVAHSMSLLAVRAETAPYRLPELPASAHEEFTAIAATARDTLVELRRVLGVLRTETEPERAPQPSLADLPELLASARAAGMSIDAEVADGPVPPATALAAYRIVQEAVSNAARHAPGAAVRVQVKIEDQLQIRVRNTASSSPAKPGGGGHGHGLLGMRERANVLGGTLSAAPAADGGFEVAASLPLEGGR